MIPQIGKTPLRGPALLDPPARFSAEVQRWLEQVFRAISAVVGLTLEPVLTVTDSTGTTRYYWKSSVRLAIPQAALVNLTAALLTNPLTQNRGQSSDAGLLVDITDYNHVLEWDGAAFQWGPGDSGSNWFVTGAPSAAGWHECDGSNVSYLKADGTLGTLTLPTTPGTWFRQ